MIPLGNQIFEIISIKWLIISVDCLTTIWFLENNNNNRYPSDPYDRLWQRYGNNAAWTNITTTKNVNVSNITSFDKPTMILGSAITPVNGTRIDFSWTSDPALDNDNPTYLLFLYFAELSRVPSNALRQFDVLIDNSVWNGSQSFTPKYLSAEVVKRMVQGSGQHTVSLVATQEATLPPILNAFEIYSVKPMTELGTNYADGMSLLTLLSLGKLLRITCIDQRVAFFLSFHMNS